MNFARVSLGPERTKFLQLEEVESKKVGGQDAWLITLSMISADPPNLFVSLAERLRKGRDYKSFTVLKSSGEVTAMKIRDLAGV